MKDANGREHEPAGSPEGGQFSAGEGGSGSEAFSAGEKEALSDYAENAEEVNAALLAGAARGRWRRR